MHTSPVKSKRRVLLSLISFVLIPAVLLIYKNYRHHNEKEKIIPISFKERSENTQTLRAYKVKSDESDSRE